MLDLRPTTAAAVATADTVLFILYPMTGILESFYLFVSVSLTLLSASINGNRQSVIILYFHSAEVI